MIEQTNCKNTAEKFKHLNHNKNSSKLVAMQEAKMRRISALAGKKLPTNIPYFLHFYPRNANVNITMITNITSA